MLRALTRIGNIMSETTEIIIAEKLGELSIQGKDKTVVNDGAVLVKKGSGKSKVRKGQSNEEYLIQKEQFERTGPMINTLMWLEEIDISKIDPQVKSDRVRLENLTERLYFNRNYKKCLEVTEQALDLFKDLSRKKITNEIEELEYLQQQCTKKLSLSS